DRQGKMARTEYQLNLKDALIVGCFQMLALIPGTSRSGITIAGALLLGLTREAAARFSFLLSVPVIFLAGSVKTIDLMRGEDEVLWGDLAGGVLLSALSAYLCIDLFLRFVNKVGMLPFVIYRLILGVGLFVVFGYQLS
ncbi:MAG: undecaprenyl-diphosphatase, partial [Gammaproteobacteria bacterium]